MDKARMAVDISVIIATYNVEAYIEKAIRSALDQQGVTVEVIVVDDGSTDSSFARAQAIADPRIRCFKLASNGGPSAARNAGIAAAKAPWIAILDGDDVFLPGRLTRMLSCAKEKQADMAVDNLLVVREADNVRFPMFETSQFAKRGIMTLADFIAGNRSFLGGYTLGYLKPVFSRDFLSRHNLGYDPTLRIGEDYMLVAEVLASGAICAVEPKAGYAYTVRAGSISHRLSLSDVTRISEADQKFLSRHKLDIAAATAQQMREKRLKEAYAFTRLVEALKQKNLPDITKITLQCPATLIYLWRPVWARIKRMAKL